MFTYTYVAAAIQIFINIGKDIGKHASRKPTFAKSRGDAPKERSKHRSIRQLDPKVEQEPIQRKVTDSRCLV